MPHVHLCGPDQQTPSVQAFMSFLILIHLSPFALSYPLVISPRRVIVWLVCRASFSKRYSNTVQMVFTLQHIADHMQKEMWTGSQKLHSHSDVVSSPMLRYIGLNFRTSLGIHCELAKKSNGARHQSRYMTTPYLRTGQDIGGAS